MPDDPAPTDGSVVGDGRGLAADHHRPVLAHAVARTPTSTTLALRGEVELATADRLAAILEHEVGQPQELVVDLAQVTFVDARALGLLVDFAVGLRGTGGRTVLRSPSQLTVAVLAHLGFDGDVFTVEPGHHPGGRPTT